ncbi:LuxR C-terminal-related transcriptional regulator [Clostridium sp.]|uniref:LuxR C-terminal-related transcriptional regulator n=1 Tax=Clostridium sp. TaxID=1506 RepID=UPI0028420E63|nr:LuxR C-terminal-related transcriptional regulator [Clostridium sp.]MDR3598609.1 LuxR C-terminal-related transcriptional regulator [Clostridium sp.]
MKNILYTRLIRPKSENMLHRNKDIQDKLDGILENKLTVVKGGAAVGKSTLISNYIGEKDKCMWLSLDENSDDLSYFWTYVLHGLKGNIEDLNFYIDMINPLVKREDIFELISSLINELINEEELIIVFDDFHYLEDKFLLESIEYFISNSSDNIHFVLISRYDIKLYLGNILMKGGIVDINSEDFNLTLEETEEFIKNTTKKNIDDDVIKEIFLISEGWIGAIKLLLTVVGSKKTIKNIPKGNKLFIDYMNNEIINSLSQGEIDFLIKTSPLSYVNPSIYKNIDNKDGFEIIDNLIGKNMLIITIDEDKKIFRYHNILRQYLIELFDKYEASVKNEIIDKLAASLIKDKNYDEALRIFVNYNRYNEALRIIEKNAHNIVSTKILNEFPLEYYNKSTDLVFIAGFSNYLSLDYERCSIIINSIDYDKGNKVRNSLKLLGLILNNSYVEECYFDFPKEIDDSLNILTKIIYYILASWALGFIGEYTKSFEMMELIKKINTELNNSYVDIMYKYNKVSLLENMGKLNECLNGYTELIEQFSTKNYKSCFTIFRTVGLPGVYIKMLRDKEAEELLLEAQKMIKEYKGKAAFSTLEVGINYNLAEVKYIQGNIDECEELLNHINKDNKDNYAYIQMLALKIRLLFFENRIKTEEFDEFMEIYKKKYGKSPYSDILGITYGMVLFEKGQYEESLNEFNKIAFACRKNGIGYLLVYSLVWKVILLNKLESDNTRECINIIKEAIFYSRDEDILFPYYKNRKYLKEIIQKFKVQLLEDPDNKEFVKKLCDLVGIKDENEVLSPREMEVLQALIDGLSNKEIGEKLFISISTVKTHIINIYSKLGVKNRVEAVNEGRKII